MSRLHDLDAERAYLGWAVADPEVLDRLPLSPDDFHGRTHSVLFGALLELREAKGAVDLVSLTRALDARGMLTRVGGSAGVTEACSLPVLPVDSVHARLRDLAVRRRLRDQLSRAIVECDAGNVDDAMAIVHEIADDARTARDRKILSAPELVEGTLRKFAEDIRDERDPLLRSGLWHLDNQVGGLVAGDLCTIGAQTNVGKSWTLLTMAVNAARRGTKYGIVSLEDPEQLWGQRLIGILTDVSSTAIRARKLSQTDHAKLMRAPALAQKLGFELAIETGATIQRIVETMRTLVRERGCQVLGIDYAQCFHGIDSGSEHQSLKRMFTLVKGTADRLGVPVVLLSQVKRGDNPDREPSKYDLKEGGDLEIKSEYVVMLWRDQKDRSVLHAKIDKSKVGGVGWTFDLAQRASGVLEEHTDDWGQHD